MEQTSEQRQALERNIVRHLIDTALAAGWTVPYVLDGEDRVQCATAEQAMDTVFSVDDSTIFFRKGKDRAHCATIILGNGIDCISDNSVGEDFEREVMDVSTAYIEQLEANGSCIAAIESERANAMMDAIRDIETIAHDGAVLTSPEFKDAALASILLLCHIVTLAEDGKVAVAESGRDCGGVEYSGTIHIIDATRAAYSALDDHIGEWADGPYYLTLCRVSESKKITPTSRDLVMEAHENGHPHHITSQFP